MSLRKKVLIIAIVALTVVSGAFAGGKKEASAPVKTADLVYVNWAEGIAYTHVAAVVLEDMMGYEVNLTSADAAPAYTAVAQGDMDAFMETWLPVLHKDYLERFKNDIDDLGHVFEGTQSGLVIPQYMADAGIKSLSDLLKPEAMEKLDKKITGIDAGAGVMSTTENEAMVKYGLTDAGYELVASSGPAMTAALKDAISREEWMVVTGWEPHWKFGVWNLTFLEQDRDTIWGSGNIHIMGRKNLSADKPELHQFLTNMFFTGDEMADLLVAYSEADDPMEMARDWVASNKSVVEKWIP